MNVFGVRDYERVSLFIDGPNLYGTVRALGADLDFRRLRRQFAEYSRLVRANYYTAVTDDEESPLTKMLDWLDYNGYAVHTKPTKEFQDELGRRKIKGNMDVDIAVDMLEAATTIDHAILFSGDGDFRPVVEALQRRGLRVTVVSSIKTAPSMIADELRRQADHFVDLFDALPHVSRVVNP